MKINLVTVRKHHADKHINILTYWTLFSVLIVGSRKSTKFDINVISVSV